MPKQNGTVERKHRHIVEIGLTLLTHSVVPPPFCQRHLALSFILLIGFPLPPLITSLFSFFFTDLNLTLSLYALLVVHVGLTFGLTPSTNSKIAL